MNLFQVTLDTGVLHVPCICPHYFQDIIDFSAIYIILCIEISSYYMAFQLRTYLFLNVLKNNFF